MDDKKPTVLLCGRCNQEHELVPGLLHDHVDPADMVMNANGKVQKAFTCTNCGATNIVSEDLLK